MLCISSTNLDGYSKENALWNSFLVGGFLVLDLSFSLHTLFSEIGQPLFELYLTFCLKGTLIVMGYQMNCWICYRMVDKLTNDPQEIGLNWWSSAMDENKHAPYMYAFLRNHHSYNRLVARKVRDWQNCPVTIPVSDAVFSVD